MSKIDFSQVINRRGSDSCKWDSSDKRLGNTDCIQLGCADMDFQSPIEIRQALQDVVNHGIFGYTDFGPHFYEGIISMYQKRHGVNLNKEQIVFTPRINIACGLCVEAFTHPGDYIILNSPSYHPLAQAAVDNGRFLIETPLKRENDSFVFDFDALEQAINDKTRMMILISPHNPTTRIWTKEELNKVAQFCIKHDLLLFVDEIHGDFVRSNYHFTSILELEGEIQDRIILSNSPAKSFNVMGCIVAYMVIRNEKLRKAFVRQIDRIGEHNPNAFANAVMKVAYQHCYYYIDELNPYIDANEDYLRNELTKLFPALKIIRREGTYLLWLDFSQVFASQQEMMDFFIKKAHVYVLPGTEFGKEFSTFARLNMGCPLQTLQQVVERIKNALANS